MTALTTTIDKAQATPTTAAATRDGLVVRFWLHAEALAAFVAGTILYFQSGGNGWFLLPLLLVPDLSLLGYLGNARAGAFVYDLVHNWAAGLAVLGLGAVTGVDALWFAGAILIAHVGMDRTVGYGLKYADSFKVTHLQRV